MRISRALCGVVATGAVLATAVVTPQPATATADEWGINGTFSATSNGEWARANDVLRRNQAVVQATWTVTTECSYPTECTGTVTSDQGWTAPIYQTGSLWYVKHTVPNWVPCPDGTAVDALQTFRFWSAAPDGSVDPASSTLIGEDKTMGPSGACGRSPSLIISMPFKLVKIS